MEDIYKLFYHIPLLREVNLDGKSELVTYPNGTIIMREDEMLYYVFIVFSGAIAIRTNNLDGKTFEISRFTKGDIFGDALIYKNKPKLLGAIVSLSSDTYLIRIHRDVFKELLEKDKNFLRNYLEYNSRRLLRMQNKLKLNSQPTLRDKLMFYIKEELARSEYENMFFIRSKEDIAYYIGATRPAISRELMALKEDGIIDYDKWTITYLKPIEFYSPYKLRKPKGYFPLEMKNKNEGR